MLLNYSFSNFCSFQGHSFFSLNTPSGKVLRRYPGNYNHTECGVQPLKTAVIVGENAGGKSNFIRSLMFLQSLFIENTIVKTVFPYVNVSALREDKNAEQFFELEFTPDGTQIFRYQLILDSRGIVSEGFYQREKRKSREHTILEYLRRGDTELFQGSAPADYPLILQGNKQKAGLFATKLALLGDASANILLDWMTHRLSVVSLDDERKSPAGRASEIEILQDPRYIDILRMVDYSILRIELDEENPYGKTMIVREDKEHRTYKRELHMDSSGVKEFFSWAIQIFRVIYEDKVIFADEMDRVLNPVLSDRIIAYMNGKDHHGQFVFTTHNVLHLNLTTYMKEQIYFITKNRENLNSEIYSLADFPEIRYGTTKIYEFCMKGILGDTADE